MIGDAICLAASFCALLAMLAAARARAEGESALLSAACAAALGAAFVAMSASALGGALIAFAAAAASLRIGASAFGPDLTPKLNRAQGALGALSAAALAAGLAVAAPWEKFASADFAASVTHATLEAPALLAAIAGLFVAAQALRAVLASDARGVLGQPASVATSLRLDLAPFAFPRSAAKMTAPVVIVFAVALAASGEALSAGIAAGAVLSVAFIYQALVQGAPSFLARIPAWIFHGAPVAALAMALLAATAQQGPFADALARLSALFAAGGATAFAFVCIAGRAAPLKDTP